MKNFLLISLTILLYNTISAQNFKVSEATQQRWAGGVCCSYGTNYSFTVEGTDTLNTFTIDTIWIGKNYYTYGQKNTFSISKVVYDNSVKYKIQISEGYNNIEGIKYDIEEEKHINKEEKPTYTCLKYKGQACIVGHVLNKRTVLEIITLSELYPIAYP